MSFLVDLGSGKRAALLQQIAGIHIPDGPDHPSEFQPRPQAGHAIGGTFSEFRSEEERREYEKNYQRMIVRGRAKTERFVLEQDLARLERDFAHLTNVVESACDHDGKAMLREMLLAAQGDNPRTDPNPDAYRSAVALATNIIDVLARSPGETPTPNVLYTPEEWARVLDGLSHGLPPDIVLAAFRNRADYFRLVTPGDAPAREVFEQTIRVMIAGHRRMRQDWAEINASAPDRRPEPPEFVLRYGGAMVGGRAAAAPPEFRNEDERRAYQAWVVADAEAAERIDRERTLAIRLKRLESDFGSIARKLYVYSPVDLRQELVRRLESAGEEDGVDYLKIADLRVSSELDAD